MSIKAINPYANKVIKTIEETTDKAVNAALDLSPEQKVFTISLSVKLSE